MILIAKYDTWTFLDACDKQKFVKISTMAGPFSAMKELKYMGSEEKIFLIVWQL